MSGEGHAADESTEEASMVFDPDTSEAAPLIASAVEAPANGGALANVRHIIRDTLTGLATTIRSNSPMLLQILHSGLPVIFLVLGTLFYQFNTDSYDGTTSGESAYLSFVDGVYLAVVSVTTVGFGDLFPVTVGAKFFQVVYIFAGLCFRESIYAARMRTFIEHLEDKVIRKLDGGAVEGGRWWMWKGGCILVEMLLIYIIGVLIILLCEDNTTKRDSPYLSAISAMTVGYGDKSFKSWLGRVLSSAWLPFSTITVERFTAFVGEACGRAHRQRILQEDVTRQEFEAAGFDSLDTGISYTDFVCYKLHALGMMSGGFMVDIKAEYNARVVANGGDRFLPFAPPPPLNV